jgi:hypothetical protein
MKKFLLYKQALADGSFIAEHGQGQELWTRTCAVLNRLPEFAAGLSWMKAQNKFKKLIGDFRSSQQFGRAQSGTDDEKFTEKEVLLNDIIELQASKTKNKDEKKAQGAVIF